MGGAKWIKRYQRAIWEPGQLKAVLTVGSHMRGLCQEGLGASQGGWVLLRTRHSHRHLGGCLALC